MIEGRENQITYLASIFFPDLPLDIHLELDVLFVPNTQHFLFELTQPFDRRFDHFKRTGGIVLGRLSNASVQLNQSIKGLGSVFERRKTLMDVP